MKLALILACCVLSPLAPRTASADAPPQPGIHVVDGASSVAPGHPQAPAAMEPAAAALLFAGLAGAGALLARRRCIAARVRNS